MRLRSSALGVDFPRERFLRTPVKALSRVVAFIDSEEQRRYNIASISSAHISAQIISIAHGLSGSKASPPKVTAKDFLPFPDWNPEPARKEGPSPDTQATLTRLLKQGRLPLHIYTSLTTPITTEDE